MPVLEEKMIITYDNMTGQIVHIGKNYFTFTPLNSNAIILVYKNKWKDVTVLEVAQSP